MNPQSKHEWVLAPMSEAGIPEDIVHEINTQTGIGRNIYHSCHSGCHSGPAKNPPGGYSMGVDTAKVTHPAPRKIAGVLSSRRAGKSQSFGMIYEPSLPSLGKRWKCIRCQKVHYSNDTPPLIPIKGLRAKEKGIWWSMPLVSCRFSYMPTFEVQPFDTCDEEMVKWVMES